MTIRTPRPDERNEIERILRSTGSFNETEIAVALELVDAWNQMGEESGYIFAVLEMEGALCGYACWGATPMTVGTYDLYWIAVEKKSHGRGFGQELLKFAERDVLKRGGRLLLIETSSQESYGGTRRFYDRAGYQLAARIPDYYRPGDDKLIFLKETR